MTDEPRVFADCVNSNSDKIFKYKADIMTLYLSDKANH